MLCATEQNQKSKCEHTQHKLFKSKWPKQHKCNQQIYNIQSQVQHFHAYLLSVNTDRSYNIEKVEKSKYQWDICILCAKNKTKNHKVYFMDWTKHNMNFSKTKVRNKTKWIQQICTLNLKSNISMRTYHL